MKDLDFKVSLFGKHPSSSEYLHLGDASPFIDSVQEWIERGYETLLKSRISSSSKDVRHFCFINKRMDSFICGSMKLSKDNKNREYPLSIAIEVRPYSSFKDSQEVLEYSKSVHQEILNIFQLKCGVEGLKEALRRLYSSRKNREDDVEELLASSIFMSEDFSQAQHFYRPLESDDFMKMMR